jgi:malate synthase
LAKEIFDEHMKGPNQIERQRDDVVANEVDLLTIPTGKRTERGLRENINVGVLYTEAWLRGKGCVPLYNLMEDAATAEISRTQLWQWIRHEASLDDGRVVSVELFEEVLAEEMKKIEEAVGVDAFATGKFKEARDLFESLSTSKTFEEFLTLPAYEQLLTTEH